MLENYDGCLSDYGQQAMDTLSIQGVLTHDDPIPTESANTYTEVQQFVEQELSSLPDWRKNLVYLGCFEELEEIDIDQFINYYEHE